VIVLHLLVAVHHLIYLILLIVDIATSVGRVLLIINSQRIFYLIAHLMVLEHHLVPVVHVHYLIMLQRALVMQWQWNGVTELVTCELHTRIVCSD